MEPSCFESRCGGPFTHRHRADTSRAECPLVTLSTCPHRCHNAFSPCTSACSCKKFTQLSKRRNEREEEADALSTIAFDGSGIDVYAHVVLRNVFERIFAAMMAL
jgi:hypothetical protein